MKHLIPLAMAALVISAAPSDSPSKTLHRVKILELEYQVEDTPEFRVTVDRERKRDPRPWLMLEAELEVETTAKNKFIPELTANWHVVIDDEFEKIAEKQAVRLTGSVTYVHLATHDGKVKIVSYVHPDTLKMLTGKDSFARSNVRSIAVEVLGPDVSEAKGRKKHLAKAVGDGANTRWWETWTRRSIDHTVIPLTKTPFLPIWSDYYPQVKAD